jgi:putative ABC transport system permease protein
MDSWREMFDFLSRHKLRTVLTGSSVAWGIFMLMLLLGAGNGLQQGVQQDFKDDATNSIWIFPSKTSLPFGGRPPGRAVRLHNDDVSAIAKDIPGVEYLTARYNLWGEFSVTYGDKKARFPVRGCHPDHLYLEKTLMVKGRFVNELDVELRRKIAVIGLDVERQLFGDEDPLGKTIAIRGVHYRVVGVYTDEGGLAELQQIYVPISTAQLVYGGADRVHQVMFTTGSSTVEQSEAMAQATRALLARRHDFSTGDKRALRVTNNVERFERITQIFRWIRVFVWLVGAGTLFAGMVAISNVMLISVRERTVEIGIRKAIGATPLSVVWMILREALFVTSVAGYTGLVLGALVVEAAREYLPPNDYVRSPEVDFQTALIATGLLILAGAVAGFVPALQAARVKPVVAMRGN